MYDNNYPGAERTVKIGNDKKTWEYSVEPGWVWGSSEGGAIRFSPISVVANEMNGKKVSTSSVILTVSNSAKAVITNSTQTPVDRITGANEIINRAFSLDNSQSNLQRKTYELPDDSYSIEASGVTDASVSSETRYVSVSSLEKDNKATIDVLSNNLLTIDGSGSFHVECVTEAFGSTVVAFDVNSTGAFSASLSGGKLVVPNGADITVTSGDEFISKGSNGGGQWVIDPQYDIAGVFTDDGYAEVANEVGNDYLYGVIDKTGKLIVPIQYQMWSFIGEGKYVACNALGDYDVYDLSTGQKVLSHIKHNFIWEFSSGLAAFQDLDTATNDPKWGFMDITGKTVIPAIYGEAYSFSGNWAFVAGSYNGGHLSDQRMIDKNGNTLLSLGNYDADVPGVFVGLAAYYSYTNDTIVVANGNSNSTNSGLMNRQGNIVVPLKYSSIEIINGAYDAVADVSAPQENWVHDYYDSQGNSISQLPSPSTDLISKKQGDKWGYVHNPN